MPFTGKSVPTKLFLNGVVFEITQQPQPVAVARGESAVFTVGVTARMKDDTCGHVNGQISYQWIKQKGGLPDTLVDGTKYSGTKTSQLTINNVDDTDIGTSYFVGVRYEAGDYNNAIIDPGGTNITRGNKGFTNGFPSNLTNIQSQIGSAVAVLKVKPTLTITQQPVSTTSIIGDTANFTATVTLDDPSYAIDVLWTSNTRGVLSNTAYPAGATSQTNTIGVITTDGIEEITFEARVSFEGSPISVTSNVATLTSREPRDILNWEFVDATDATLYNRRSFDFTDEPERGLSVNFDTSDFLIAPGRLADYLMLHSPEKDLNVTLEMWGARGQSAVERSGLGRNLPGELGGYTLANITLPRNVEFTLFRPNYSFSSNACSAIFFYRGSQLLFAVGGGGSRSTTGGAGTVGRGALDLTTLDPPFETRFKIPPTSAYGAGIDLYPGDGVFQFGTNSYDVSGKLSTCSKGRYWVDTEGIDFCQENSPNRIKYKVRSGAEVAESFSLIRGFKPAYDIQLTRGAEYFTFDATGRIIEVFGGSGGDGVIGGVGDLNGGQGGRGYALDPTTIVTSVDGGALNDIATFRISLNI